jgi:acyl-CoA synthetase (AMP-forming)/AMP-acid ligase II
MTELAHVGDVLAMHARLHPDRIGARDLEREMSFRTWNARATRLANALLGIGLSKGDRICVLAYNCVEWLEIYAAAAIAGLVVVPINFRFVGPEIRYIVGNCEARALIIQDELLDIVDSIRSELSVPATNYIVFGGARSTGYRAYEQLIAQARESRPDTVVASEDPWTLLYTSGTTGQPKGAIRSHRGSAILSLVTEVEMRLSRRDAALLVMPMCHANSLFFFGAFTYCGAACTVYSRKNFDPEHLVRTLAEGGATFTSLVPTHYIMMLALSAAVRGRYSVEAHQTVDFVRAGATRDQTGGDGILQEFRPFTSCTDQPNVAGSPCCSQRNN